MKISDPTGRLARWSLYLQIYDFEIIHKEGKKHLNADAVSRALLNIDIEKEFIEDSDLSDKILDPYEDAGFTHFIKTGKFLPGSSSKHCKRVKKIAAHYKIENDIIYYFPDPEDMTISKMVPKIENRKEINRAAHLPGHFSIEKTIPEIKKKYYWKNMLKDIEYIIKTCMICLRHQTSATQNHPALALPITGIFDRIGIDCVFGLPETNDGFKGILVITEYLTKYPYAIPLKSKTAREIAGHLFTYISLFGPPKEILSDQGKEFLNEVVDEVLTWG
jgi:hypothetical protein